MRTWGGSVNGTEQFWVCPHSSQEQRTAYSATFKPVQDAGLVEKVDAIVSVIRRSTPSLVRRHCLDAIQANGPNTLNFIKYFYL